MACFLVIKLIFNQLINGNFFQNRNHKVFCKPPFLKLSKSIYANEKPLSFYLNQNVILCYSSRSKQIYMATTLTINTKSKCIIVNGERA